MTRHRAIYVVACLLVFCTGAVAFWFYERDGADEATSVEITRSFRNIERTIGYVGFIHHFKNHVLRPNTPIYAERAKVSYQLATKEIMALQSSLIRAGIPVDVSELQNTLKLYSDAIDVVSKSHLQGVPVTEIDQRIQVPDDTAASILLNIQTEVERLLQERRQSAEKSSWLSLLFFIVVVICLIASLAYAWFERQRQRHRQREFLFQQQELERSHQHSEGMAKLVRELERSNRDLDSYAYIASHDLKEPIRGIAINADLLKRENVSEKGNQRIERMIELTTRMEQLISDLLFFSRLGRSEQSREDIDLGAIIKSIEQELLETLDQTCGTIKIETALPQVHANRNKFKIAFQNLIVNALKYNDSESKLVNIGFRTTVDVDGELLENVFYVQDNGIGIDSKNHDKVLRIFTRLNRAKDYGEGTGAGLSFVSKIIEEYGSTITIDSRLGQGTTFYFSLPLAGSNQSDEFTTQEMITP